MTHWRSQTDIERRKLADKLRYARESAQLTQREVARRLTIPQSTVSELENGQRRLDMAELILLAELYGRSPVWFLDGNGLSDGNQDGFSSARDGVGQARDGIARDGVGRDGHGRDGVGRDGVGRDGANRDGVARDGANRDGVARDGATSTRDGDRPSA